MDFVPFCVCTFPTMYSFPTITCKRTLHLFICIHIQCWRPTAAFAPRRRYSLNEDSQGFNLATAYTQGEARGPWKAHGYRTQRLASSCRSRSRGLRGGRQEGSKEINHPPRATTGQGSKPLSLYIHAVVTFLRLSAQCMPRRHSWVDRRRLRTRDGCSLIIRVCLLMLGWVSLSCLSVWVDRLRQHVSRCREPDGLGNWWWGPFRGRMCDCVQYHVVLGLLLCGLSQGT